MGINAGLRLSWGRSKVQMSARQFPLFLGFSVSCGEFVMGYETLSDGLIARFWSQQLGMSVYTTNNWH